MEGRRAVVEALSARRRGIIDVWLASGARPDPILERIGELARAQRVPVRTVSRDRLIAEARTQAAQGVLAHAHPLPEADLDELLGIGGDPPLLLALDGVTDPQNLGSLLRSALAARVTGVVLPRHRAVHITPAAAKAAAGAIEYMPLATVAGMPAALSHARERKCWVVGLAADGDRSLFDLDLATEPLVLVLGAEGDGLSRLVRQRCDLVVSIPVAEAVSSLNVAVAGALAMFEVDRRRRDARPGTSEQSIDTGSDVP